MARGVYLACRPEAAVSVDAAHWYEVAQLLLLGENPYERTSYLNWPPVWPACLWLIAKASIALNVSFGAALWTFLIAAESLTILALLRLFEAFGRHGAVPVLVGVSLNPALIFQVTQHGSFDVLMMASVLPAIGRFVRFRTTRRDADWFWGCAWLGLAGLTKTVPLALLPIAALAARPIDGGKVILGAVLAIAPAFVAVWMLHLAAPQPVWDNVVTYRSFGGWYGITGLLDLLTPGAVSPATYASGFALMLVAWLIGGFLFLGRGAPVEPRSIVLAAGLTMLALPTIGSGYGSQYIWWYWPTLLLAYVLYPSNAWRAVLGVAGVVAAATYLVEYLVFPSHGGWLLPELAESTMRRDVQTLVRLPLFLASLLTLVGGLVLLARRRPGPREPHAGARHAAAAVTACAR